MQQTSLACPRADVGRAAKIATSIDYTGELKMEMSGKSWVVIFAALSCLLFMASFLGGEMANSRAKIDCLRFGQMEIDGELFFCESSRKKKAVLLLDAKASAQ